jgi:hypothetical protein
MVQALPTRLVLSEYYPGPGTFNLPFAAPNSGLNDVPNPKEFPFFENSSIEYYPGPGTFICSLARVLEDPKVPLAVLAFICDLSKSLRMIYYPGPKLLSALPPRLLPSLTPNFPPDILALFPPTS